ncbi:hypothetical protein SPONN_2799 [uncultured Candidatus Thioglobus sp.]|nr:hypothetical protein SPONN_2799 [uncultured Candidatus Thioglobus sp.]SMM99487.1 hypothetical protein SPONL_621 [uncultured Candidatus Thioglobus sp.]
MEEISQEKFAENQKVFLDVVARYYGDPDFKAKLDANPTDVLTEEGVEIPEGSKVELLFNTDKLIHIVLPYLEGEDD